MNHKVKNMTLERNSKNRKAIIEILSSEKLPVTAEYIHMKLKEINPSASISTVYRSLDKLILNNLALKSIIMDSNKAKYEINRKSHTHYLICTNCKLMQPLNICPLNNLNPKLQNETGFKITGHKLEIYGTCKDCNNKL